MLYRKRPVTIEAVRWVGLNRKEIEDFCGDAAAFISWGDDVTSLTIHTLDGDHKANKGDYIIKDADGEYYPCKPEIFKKKYEVAE